LMVKPSIICFISDILTEKLKNFKNLPIKYLTYSNLWVSI
jgi:hypothetical protein